MVGGTNSEYGRWGNEESVTYTFQKRLQASNPTLTTTKARIAW